MMDERAPTSPSTLASFLMTQIARNRCSLLVVDDEPYILTALAAFLHGEFEVLTADSVEAAQKFFDDREIDLILTDQKMRRMIAWQMLAWGRQRSPRTVRLMMTGS